MAGPTNYPNALAPTGPDFLALTGNYFSGNVRWVDSTNSNASDAANTGLEPELPKATVFGAGTGAYAASTAGDLIVCGSSHAETISAAVTMGTADIMIVGLANGALRPKFTSAVAGVMLTITANRLYFFNCYFPASTAATTARINVNAGTDFHLVTCQMDFGANDTTNGVTIAAGASNTEFEDTIFTAVASRPARAVQVTGAVNGLFFDGCVFDGGAFGWTSRAFEANAVVTGAIVRDTVLLNRSDWMWTTVGSLYKCFGLRAGDNTGCRLFMP